MTRNHRIDRIASADLTVAPGPPAFQVDHQAAIEAHWQAAAHDNPHLFDGTVYLCSHADLIGDRMAATCHAVRFATLLYWRKRQREAGGSDGLRNTFGDVVLRGSDGGILMGRMAAQTANAGRICLPGGSFDPSDVRDGRIDPTACILRECAEETGFRPGDFTLDPQLLVYRDHRCVAYAQVATLPIPAREARDRAQAFLGTETEPELEDILVVASIADADRLIPDTFERHLIAHVFQETA